MKITEASANPSDYPDDFLVVLIERCKAVPKMDVIGSSDPYGECEREREGAMLTMFGHLFQGFAPHN